MFIVTDPDSGMAVGPFESKDEAKEYFITLATREEWTDVLELVEKTGKPFVEKGDEFVFVSGRAEQLVLTEVEAPVDLTEVYGPVEYAKEFEV